MEKKQLNDYLAIPRSDVAKWIKELMTANYTYEIFGYIIEKYDLALMFDSNDICKILKIQPDKLEICRKRGMVKGYYIGGAFIYPAFEIVSLAVKLNFAERAKKIKINTLSKIHFK